MIVSKTKILMKQILVLMAILLLISACSDANKPEDEQIQEDEAIEEITKEEEPVKPSPYQVAKERGYDCGVYEKEYDSNGNLITHTQFDRDGLTSLRTEYEYDGNGNVIKVAWYDSDGSNISLSEYEYEYDNANRLYLHLQKEIVSARYGSGEDTIILFKILSNNRRSKRWMISRSITD